MRLRRRLHGRWMLFEVLNLVARVGQRVFLLGRMSAIPFPAKHSGAIATFGLEPAARSPPALSPASLRPPARSATARDVAPRPNAGLYLRVEHNIVDMQLISLSEAQMLERAVRVSSLPRKNEWIRPTARVAKRVDVAGSFKARTCSTP